MLSTIRIHKENGLRKAFPSMNKPPWIAVMVVESEYDMGHLLVIVAEVCRFQVDGKEDLWRRRMSS